MISPPKVKFNHRHKKIKNQAVNAKQRWQMLDFCILKHIIDNMKIMNGDKFVANTHTDFLNTVLAKDYTGWMRCVYHISNEIDIYFIRLNGKQSKEGWTNTLKNDSCFIEEYTGNPHKKLDAHKYTNFPKKRATFDIIEKPRTRETPRTRAYIFRGVFEYATESIASVRHIWNKIADEFHC